MIDCHAHAFPTFEYQACRVGSRIPLIKTELSAQGAAKVDLLLEKVQSFTRDMPPLVNLESMSKMQGKRSPRANRILENVLSVVAMPTLISGGSTDRLLESMNRFGIKKTVVIAALPLATNEWLLQEARRELEDRMIPVATLPKVPDDSNDIDWYNAWSTLVDSGARGFKIHLNMDGLSPEHIAYRTLFEVADKRKLFVIIHTGSFHVATYKKQMAADPELFEHLLIDYPDVPVCMAHMNRNNPQAMWGIMKRFSQVYTDTSWQPSRIVHEAINQVGSDRILLGSDWPLLHGDLQGDSLKVLRRATNASIAEKIGKDNAIAFLGE